jgi:hypothetical protein
MHKSGRISAQFETAVGAVFKLRLCLDRRMSAAGFRSIDRLRISIAPEKQIAQCLSATQGLVTLTLMFDAVVQQMATLTQSFQIARSIVRRVMIQMCRGQDNPRRADHQTEMCRGTTIVVRQTLDGAPVTIAPNLAFLIPPAAVSKMVDLLPVWATAGFATTFCSLETNHF